ncbi:MAG: ion transporter [Gammaproteobacteria bacterium]|nr:ion transporter [Gammaproteobacteria bacterium]NND35931.1 ion transporter [Gammaproteobacteria bacterium]
MSLQDVIERPDTRAGRVFSLTIQSLIVLSLLGVAVETLPNLSADARRALRYFEIFTVTVFTIEYLLRIVIADRPLRFMTSFYGIIDLCAIAPFYIATSLDLRALRGFRLLRVFRVFKLVRYSQAMQRYHRAFVMSREELVLFGIVSALVLFLAGLGIYYFENPVQPEVFSSVFSSLWWAVVTLTTVGYGDMVPVTLGGRLFTFVLLVIGIGVVAVPTAILSGALAKARDEENSSRDASSRRSP